MSEERIHVYPLDGPEHQANIQCWCEPEIDSKNPDSGAEVWVHKQIQ